ncbi:hypothetical protein AAF712_013759 [Marasmius tenuissimus]|uniref:F-box domain-containing protein n=1 Tax=Marasmius tenuissimus TaxID=585030 RepID=A0ABR2ZE52_9AGAR
MGALQSQVASSDHGSPSASQHVSQQISQIPLCSNCNADVQYIHSPPIPAHLHQLDNAITTLEATLAHLRRERSSLHTQIQRRRSLISPIRQLPDEIWLLVIRWASPSGYGVEISCPETLTPRVLGQTCLRLRRLIYHSPTIWSAISIDLSFLQVNHTSLLQWVLNITHKAPLTLRIDHTDGSGIHFPDVSARLRRVLAKALAQAKALQIDYNLIISIDLKEDFHCPQLQRLSISHVHSPSPPSTHYSYRQLRALLQAPQLAHLTLNDLSWLATVPMIPHTRLTSFHCGVCPEETPLSLLPKQFPHLHSLDILVTHRTSEKDLQQITFPLLQKLTLSWDDSSGLPILDYITTPTLEDLDLAYSWSSSGPGCIMSFFRRSACPLRILRIHLPLSLAWGTREEPEWDTLLLALPALQELHLCVTPSSQDALTFFEALTLRPTHPAILPHLTELHIEIQKREWDGDSYKDVVRCVKAILTLSESRRPRFASTPTPLRYLRIDTKLIPNFWGVEPYPPPNHPYPADIYQRVQALMKSGMECSTYLDFT